jgi:hypothetical protein
MPLTAPVPAHLGSQGVWQKRKKLWASTGLNDSVGRDKNLHPGRASGPGGYTIRDATTSQFCPHLADAVRAPLRRSGACVRAC